MPAPQDYALYMYSRMGSTHQGQRRAVRVSVLFDTVTTDMTEEEVALSLSTPGDQMTSTA